VRNGLPQWEIDRRGEIGEIDRNVMKASLEEQFRAGMVSSQHYWQCRTEIRDARRRADLVGIGRSLPYEAQMARSAQLVKLAAFVAVWFLISTRQFWWLLLVPGAFLAGGLVNLVVLRRLMSYNLRMRVSQRPRNRTRNYERPGIAS
jgi:hypothetical protein